MRKPLTVTPGMARQIRLAVRSHYHCAICPQRSQCVYGHGGRPAMDFYDCDADTYATGYLAAMITYRPL